MLKHTEATIHATVTSCPPAPGCCRLVAVIPLCAVGGTVLSVWDSEELGLSRAHGEASLGRLVRGLWASVCFGDAAAPRGVAGTGRRSPGI